MHIFRLSLFLCLLGVGNVFADSIYLGDCDSVSLEGDRFSILGLEVDDIKVRDVFRCSVNNIVKYTVFFEYKFFSEQGVCIAPVSEFSKNYNSLVSPEALIHRSYYYAAINESCSFSESESVKVGSFFPPWVKVVDADLSDFIDVQNNLTNFSGHSFFDFKRRWKIFREKKYALFLSQLKDSSHEMVWLSRQSDESTFLAEVKVSGYSWLVGLRKLAPGSWVMNDVEVLSAETAEM